MGKKAASWTIDEDILTWIGNKLGSKSQFVNNILRKARIREDEVKMIKRKFCQTCFGTRFKGADCLTCEVA